MEFATVYFSQKEVFYQITKRQSGAISTITADVRTKRKFQTHLGPARFGTTPDGNEDKDGATIAVAAGHHQAKIVWEAVIDSQA